MTDCANMKNTHMEQLLIPKNGIIVKTAGLTLEREHEDIVKAIAREDPEAVPTAMRAHSGSPR